MTKTLHHVGISLIVLAVAGPVSYCEMRSSADRAREKIACIEAHGEWQSAWGGTCDFGVKP